MHFVHILLTFALQHGIIAIKNIGNMHVVSTYQIAGILHFNYKTVYHKWKLKFPLCTRPWYVSYMHRELGVRWVKVNLNATKKGTNFIQL